MTTRTIEDTLDDLRDSLDRLHTDLRRQATAATKSISSEAPEIAKRARSVGQAIYDDGTEKASGLLESGRRLWNSASDGVSEAGDNIRVVATRARGVIADAASVADEGGRKTAGEVRRFVRERPLASLFLAVAAGLVVAKVFDRD